MVAVWKSGISVVTKNSLMLVSQVVPENSRPGLSAHCRHTGAWLLHGVRGQGTRTTAADRVLGSMGAPAGGLAGCATCSELQTCCRRQDARCLAASRPVVNRICMISAAAASMGHQAAITLRGADHVADQRRVSGVRCLDGCKACAVRDFQLHFACMPTSLQSAANSRQCPMRQEQRLHRQEYKASQNHCRPDNPSRQPDPTWLARFSKAPMSLSLMSQSGMVPVGSSVNQDRQIHLLLISAQAHGGGQGLRHALIPEEDQRVVLQQTPRAQTPANKAG